MSVFVSFISGIRFHSLSRLLVPQPGSTSRTLVWLRVTGRAPSGLISRPLLGLGFVFGGLPLLLPLAGAEVAADWGFGTGVDWGVGTAADYCSAALALACLDSSGTKGKSWSSIPLPFFCKCLIQDPSKGCLTGASLSMCTTLGLEWRDS
jgi:hypothetical protein